jgi:MFS family permease
MDERNFPIFLSASFFTMIIIVFAGGWSDKKKLRKPLMLFAMIGEFLGSIPSLVSAIYFDEIPMQFAHTLSYVLPAMFGGLGMMMMGCYAYLTCITTKENRTARFGIFAIYIAVLPTIVAPFSGHLLKAVGYVCKNADASKLMGK